MTMKKLLVALVLAAAPAALNAQEQVQVAPVDASDNRLEFVQPFMEQLLKGGADSAIAFVTRVQPAAAQNTQLVGSLKMVADQFGGGKYVVDEYLTGRGRDIVVRLRSTSGEGAAAFAIILDPTTDALSGFAPVTLPGS